MQSLNKLKNRIKNGNKTEKLKDLNIKYKKKMDKLIKKKRLAEEDEDENYQIEEDEDGDEESTMNEELDEKENRSIKHKNKKKKRGGDEFESNSNLMQDEKKIKAKNLISLFNNKNKIDYLLNTTMNSGSGLITCENCGLTMTHHAKTTHDEKECEALFENYVFDGKTVATQVQRDEIKKILEETKLVKGRMHYVVSGKWWGLWKSYVQFDEDHKVQGSHPGPINNDDLVETTRKKRVPRKKEEKKEEDKDENGKQEKTEVKIDTPKNESETQTQSGKKKLKLKTHKKKKFLV
jgi:hypothetical protein